MERAPRLGLVLSRRGGVHEAADGPGARGKQSLPHLFKIRDLLGAGSRFPIISKSFQVSNFRVNTSVLGPKGCDRNERTIFFKPIHFLGGSMICLKNLNLCVPTSRCATPCDPDSKHT